MASYLIPAALAATNGYVTFQVANPDLPEARKVPAYFMNVEYWGPIVATVGYLLFCYFGKKIMMKREPFQLKGTMLVYNFYQTFFNSYCIYLFVTAHRAQGLKLWGNYPDMGRASWGISQVVWLHYNNKYVELLDTFFMVMRKKFDQLSFLHMYHHTLLIWSWFVVMRLEPVGDCYFGSSVNTFVHVIMYSYYGLAALGVNCFWKKYITQVQMLQFCICASHSIYTAWLQNTAFWLPYLQLWVMVNMLVLFANFYMKRYKKGGDANKGAKKQ